MGVSTEALAMLTTSTVYIYLLGRQVGADVDFKRDAPRQATCEERMANRPLDLPARAVGLPLPCTCLLALSVLSFVGVVLGSTFQTWAPWQMALTVSAASMAIFTTAAMLFLVFRAHCCRRDSQLELPSDELRTSLIENGCQVANDDTD